jgi:4-hydroxy-tetrahydrodipicolinate reductase
MATLNIAIAGAAGRMGRALVEAVLHSRDLKLSGALELKGSPDIGKDAGELVGSSCGVKIGDDAAKVIARSGVLVDFTRPEGTLSNLAACRKHGVNAVIGTTGFSAAQKKEITDAARDIAVVMSPNFSVGVNVAFRLLDVAARSLGQGYDVEIAEAHHRHRARRCGWARWWPRRWAVISSRMRCTGAKASPASARTAPSASPRCAAATWWASTA